MMAVRIAFTAVLLLSTFAVTSRSIHLDTRGTSDLILWEETISIADSRSFPYEERVHAARWGDPESLQELLAFSHHTDAAGSLDHGVVLTGILAIVGDRTFAAAIRGQREQLRARLRGFLEAGLDYGPGNRRSDELGSLFPLSFEATR